MYTCTDGQGGERGKKMKFRSSRTSLCSYQIVWSVIPSRLKSPLSVFVTQYTVVVIPVVVGSRSSVVSITVSIIVDVITEAIDVITVVIAILSNQMLIQRCCIF